MNKLAQQNRVQFWLKRLPVILISLHLMACSTTKDMKGQAPEVNEISANPSESNSVLMAKESLSNEERLEDDTSQTGERFFESYQLGMQAALAGDTQSAIQIWQTLLEQSPTLKHQQILQNNIAVLLMQQKKYAESQTYLLDALNADLQTATLLDNLNQLYAYQAQQAYKEVFVKAKVHLPRGEMLSLTPIDLTSVPVEPNNEFSTDPRTTQAQDE